MSILAHKANYSRKYINAEITDSGSNFHIVHIRHVIGDFFMTRIDNQTYVFRIDGAKIKTFAQFGQWTVRKLYYDISHYNPIDGKDQGLIDKFLADNQLPRIDRKLFDSLKFLSKVEKKDTEIHDIIEMYETIANKKEEYPEQAKNFLAFLNQLSRDKIVAPVKPIVEKIQDDLITTDAKFLGDTFSLIQLMDNENRLMTNVPVKAKKEWAKIALVAMMIIMVVVVGYMAYSQHWFDNLGKSMGGGFSAPKAQDIMSQYKTPQALKDAIDAGTVKYESLPQSVRDMVDKIKTPKVVELQE